jgi:hypothetical protein
MPLQVVGHDLVLQLYLRVGSPQQRIGSRKKGNQCLAEWPGVPIADQEGVIISKALGKSAAFCLLTMAN